MQLASTAARVRDNTAPALNARLDDQTQGRMARIRHGDRIAARLGELEREWDIERAVETEAPATIASGLALGILVDRRFLGVSAFAAGMLLLHSLHGWYPLLPVLRRLGMRTAREIADEAFELKSSRGDFEQLRGDEATRARTAYAAAAIH